MALKREEAVLVREIKHAAAKGNTPLVRQQAKSLVQVRQQQARLGAGGAHLRGLRSSLTTASASAKVAQTMGSATQAMAAMGQVCVTANSNRCGRGLFYFFAQVQPGQAGLRELSLLTSADRYGGHRRRLLIRIRCSSTWQSSAGRVRRWTWRGVRFFLHEPPSA